MGDFLARVAASVVGRSVFQFVVLPLVGVGAVAAVIDSWNYLLAAPIGIKFALAVGALFGLIWLTAVVVTFLNSPRYAAGAPRKILWYKLPIRQVLWDLESYLGCSRAQNGPMLITQFNVRYKINWGEGITPRRAYIECKRTKTFFDALTDPGNNYVKAEDAGPVTRGRWYACQVSFEIGGREKLLPEEFLSKLDGFWFVFEYDNQKRFRRYFSRDEVEQYINRVRRVMVPSSEPGPIG